MNLLRHTIASRFARAAHHYDAAARLQQQAGQRILDRLALSAPVSRLIDVGCGSGWLTAALASHSRQVVALDLAPQMAQMTASRCRVPAVVADVRHLPIGSGVVDVLVSNLMLQWVTPLPVALAEIRRVLRPGGRALVQTLVDGSLMELGDAFAAVDGHRRINAFLPADAVVAAAHAAGFDALSADAWRLTLGYDSARALCRELKGVGANTLTDGHHPLTPRRWTMVEQAFAHRTPRMDTGHPVRWELLLLELQA